MNKKRSLLRKAPGSISCYVVFPFLGKYFSRTWILSDSPGFKLIKPEVPQKLLLVPSFVRNAQFVSSFGSAACQNISSASRSHSGLETMLVSSFSLRRLECSFHCLFILYLQKECKDRDLFCFYQCSKKIV